MTTGLILAKNIMISGFNTEQSTRAKIDSLLDKGQPSHILFFNLKENFKGESTTYPNITMPHPPKELQIIKPAIIGYIIEPFAAFPLYK
jgi:hypothetical protein